MGSDLFLSYWPSFLRVYFVETIFPSNCVEKRKPFLHWAAPFLASWEMLVNGVQLPGLPFIEVGLPLSLTGQLQSCLNPSWDSRPTQHTGRPQFFSVKHGARVLCVQTWLYLLSCLTLYGFISSSIKMEKLLTLLRCLCKWRDHVHKSLEYRVGCQQTLTQVFHFLRHHQTGGSVHKYGQSVLLVSLFPVYQVIPVATVDLTWSLGAYGNPSWREK